ncbi:MAG: STAS domain-containing protein [Acidimicrobiia bacterium]
MFTINVDRRPGQIHYTIAGTVGPDEAHVIRLAEEPALSGDVVVVELGDVIELDDYAFGALVALVRRAREADAQVVVITTEGSVRDRIIDTGLERLTATCERRTLDDKAADELVPA